MPTRQRGIETVVIAPDIEDEHDVDNKVVGLATKQSLELAGVAHAAGVVAATDDDTDNLSVLINARALNPGIFLVVRQNHHDNELAFNAANANLIMQPSLVSARRILLTLISPLIQVFLDRLEERPNLLVDAVYPRLLETFDRDPASLWVITVSADETPAVVEEMTIRAVTMQDLLRDPRDRSRALRCVPLLLERGADRTVLPDLSTALASDDRVLVCGVKEARRALDSTLRTRHTLEYLVTGVEAPRTAIGRLRLARAARVTTPSPTR